MDDSRSIYKFLMDFPMKNTGKNGRNNKHNSPLEPETVYLFRLCNCKIWSRATPIWFFLAQYTVNAKPFSSI